MVGCEAGCQGLLKVASSCFFANHVLPFVLTCDSLVSSVVKASVVDSLRHAMEKQSKRHIWKLKPRRRHHYMCCCVGLPAASPQRSCPPPPSTSRDVEGERFTDSGPRSPSLPFSEPHWSGHPPLASKGLREMRRRRTFPRKVSSAGVHLRPLGVSSSNNSMKFDEHVGLMCIKRGCGLRMCHLAHHGNCSLLIRVRSPRARQGDGDIRSRNH